MGNVYATQADRNLYGVPSTALGALTSQQVDAALARASAVMDTFFGGRYAMPLASWDVSVTSCCVYLADYYLLSSRGFNPAAGADANVLARYEEMFAGRPGVEPWLKQVQRRAAHPDVVEATQDAKHQRPRVISSSVVDTSTGATGPNRGW